MGSGLKSMLLAAPVVGPMLRSARRAVSRAGFPGSASYWEGRYAAGGTSGPGSYGRLADFKAGVLNRFVREHRIASVLELGCGDGAQLELADYPSYVGVDVSETAVELCRRRFAGDPTKRFIVHGPASVEPLPACELALSLDVIFHLVEDEVFAGYMAQLFGCATRYVVIYSSDTSAPSDAPHVRHRPFSAWVRDQLPGWRLLTRVANRHPYAGDIAAGSFADFFIYAPA
ncbi:MAG TPA: class I SAM-dependent methyltransferase [Gemmatimonadales bacterium]|nr:class I SAM-dependent methyltransferase [Gemmatimonadales bacterium]